MGLLADAGQQLSGAWVLELLKTIIIAVGTAGAAWIVAFRKGEKKGTESATNNVTLQTPMPEVPVRKVYSPPTFSQHMALVDRVGNVERAQENFEKETREAFAHVHNQAAKNNVDLLNAGHERERRLIDKLDGIARGFHGRVDDLLKAQVPTRKS